LNLFCSRKYKKNFNFLVLSVDPIGPKTTKVQNQECSYYLGYYIIFSKKLEKLTFWTIVENSRILDMIGASIRATHGVKSNRKCRTSERLLVPSLWSCLNTNEPPFLMMDIMTCILIDHRQGCRNVKNVILDIMWWA
jgi:hypothetical protein